MIGSGQQWRKVVPCMIESWGKSRKNAPRLNHGISITFTPNSARPKKKKKKKKEYDDENSDFAYERFLVWRDEGS